MVRVQNKFGTHQDFCSPMNTLTDEAKRFYIPRLESKNTLNMNLLYLILNLSTYLLRSKMAILHKNTLVLPFLFPL